MMTVFLRLLYSYTVFLIMTCDVTSLGRCAEPESAPRVLMIFFVSLNYCIDFRLSHAIILN